jgi:peptide/nickel transport system substrate-binding protein
MVHVLGRSEAVWNIRWRRGGLLALGLAAALAAAGCSQDEGSGETADGGGKFVIAIDLEPDTLDPQGNVTGVVAGILKYSVETLTHTSAAGELIPALATGWETSPDGLELKLTLREGVKFHDGAPFNAEAVKATLERVLDPEVKVPYRNQFTAIREIRTPSEHEVVLVLSAPSPALAAALSLETAGILSPASLTEKGNTRQRVVLPVGTGPYVMDSYDPREGISLSRFDDYWGDKPYYSDVNFKIVPESSSRESMLRSGEAQLILAPPLSSIDALEKDGKFTISAGMPARTLYAVFNTRRAPFDNKLVRQALNHAVDRQAIINGVMHGMAEAATGPLAPALAGGCTMDHAYDYNPDKARELLAEAGISNLTLEFAAPAGRYPQAPEVAQAISGYLGEIGVKANVATLDWPTYVGKVTSLPDDNVDLHILGWAASFVDPQQPMSQFDSSQSPPNGLATSFYANAEVDRLLAAAAREIDPERRADQFCQAMKIVWDEAPFIFLWAQKYPVAYSASLTGIEIAPNEYVDAIHVRPAE